MHVTIYRKQENNKYVLVNLRRISFISMDVIKSCFTLRLLYTGCVSVEWESFDVLIMNTTSVTLHFTPCSQMPDQYANVCIHKVFPLTLKKSSKSL